LEFVDGMLQASFGLLFNSGAVLTLWTVKHAIAVDQDTQTGQSFQVCRQAPGSKKVRAVF